MPKGTSKVMFWIQNGDMGLPGSTYPLIFDVLVRCQKIIIFGRLPDGPKNRALERQRVDFVAASDRRGCRFWPGGSQGPPRARGLVKKKNDRGAEEQLVQDLTRHGPMAQRIVEIFRIVLAPQHQHKLLNLLNE